MRFEDLTKKELAEIGEAKGMLIEMLDLSMRLCDKLKPYEELAFPGYGGLGMAAASSSSTSSSITMALDQSSSSGSHTGFQTSNTYRVLDSWTRFPKRMPVASPSDSRRSRDAEQSNHLPHRPSEAPLPQGGAQLEAPHQASASVSSGDDVLANTTHLR